MLPSVPVPLSLSFAFVFFPSLCFLVAQNGVGIFEEGQTNQMVNEMSVVSYDLFVNFGIKVWDIFIFQYYS